ncbi:DUF1684 domain-containing protein [Kineococcus glutinatus]|uniref:DUF1684 domain-containing protein n=1 Tax=Kineococcus glutinatus TaxID=1070872 RepID=A0ABP9I966_9ACTN
MTTTVPTTVPDHTAGARREWELWRAERTATLSLPHGWLSLTALHWLSPHPQRHGDVPGEWSATDEAVTVTASAGDGLVLDGDPLTGTRELRPLDGAPGTPVEAGERVVEVLRRGTSAALRVRDPRSPLRAAFTGVPVFDFDPAWVLPGRFRPATAPEDVTVSAVVAGLSHTYRAAGRVSFEHDGRTVELVAFGDAGGELRVLFTDATSGVSTTGTVRSLAVPAPAGDGSVVLDLNRAANLPCAFSDHATCPLAPAGNRLPFAVEAGERDPR